MNQQRDISMNVNIDRGVVLVCYRENNFSHKYICVTEGTKFGTGWVHYQTSTQVTPKFTETEETYCKC